MSEENRPPDDDLSKLSPDQLRARQAIVVAKLKKAVRQTRFARFEPLPFQRDWYQDRRPISVLVLPNQMGKTTTGAIKILGGCLGGLPAALTGQELPRQWARGILAGKRFMAAGASFKKITTETILPKLKEYLSEDMLVRTKRTMGFETEFHFVTGAALILKSYEQKIKDFEGGNWDGVWFDEPPPQNIFQATRRGQMATEGWCIITATPLSEPWMLDDLIIPSQSLDCLECSGGEVPHADVVAAQPFHGAVYVPETQHEMHDMCRECHGGYLPHAKITEFLAGIQNDAERRARQYGEFMNFAALEFGYVGDDHVVDDFDPPLAWPWVEIVDPAPKRGLHIKWYTCDEQDRWYNTHAERIPSDGGFRQMVKAIWAHRARIAPGRTPDICLMDPRGGAHRMVTQDGAIDWFEGFRKEGVTYTPAHAPSIVDHSNVQSLHDWLKPLFDPSKDTVAVPRLRFCRRLRQMKKGPLWAYERFTWDPFKSPRRQWEQEAKDFIDCDTYLALWVQHRNLTFRKMQEAERPRGPGLAASYASGGPMPGRSGSGGREPWRPQPSLSRSYGNPMNDGWVSRIRGSYTDR